MKPRLIALDWGTSSLRAYLLSGAGEILDERAKSWGIMHVPDGDFATAFATIVQGWQGPNGTLPVIAAGMIGSAQGWHEVPYQACPVGLTQLAAGLASLVSDGARLRIVPGVIDPGAVPNVMRGEEAQIIGALDRAPDLCPRACLIMPGTHSKWVEVIDGKIQTFATYMTGELFALLRDHSILGRPARQGAASGGLPQELANQRWRESFERGLVAARESGPSGAMSLLFSARTLVLVGRLGAQDSLDYLSGLLIGEELRCALLARTSAETAPVALIGDPRLCERYEIALQLFGVSDVRTIPNTSVAGLWRIAVSAGLV